MAFSVEKNLHLWVETVLWKKKRKNPNFPKAKDSLNPNQIEKYKYVFNSYQV